MTQAGEKRLRRGYSKFFPRPKLRRTGHITIRLSTEERAAIDDLAARAGLMTGSFVRQTIFGAPQPRQVRRPVAEREALARILGQLGHVGGNLNQLAHHANAGLPVTRGELTSALDDLREVRDAILLALGRGT